LGRDDLAAACVLSDADAALGIYGIYADQQNNAYILEFGNGAMADRASSPASGRSSSSRPCRRPSCRRPRSATAGLRRSATPSALDDRTSLVTVWVGNNHAAQVMKLEPLD